jgi:hypothetical protein
MGDITHYQYQKLFKWRYEKTNFGNSKKLNQLEVVEEVISPFDLQRNSCNKGINRSQSTGKRL